MNNTPEQSADARLTAMEGRLLRIEEKLGLQPTPVSDPSPPVLKPEPTPVVSAPRVVAADVPASPIPDKSTTSGAVDKQPDTPPTPAAKQGSIEANIGAQWLSRIGIAILVIGLAFGVAQAYQYLGPLFKIGCGIAAGLAL